MLTRGATSARASAFGHVHHDTHTRGLDPEALLQPAHRLAFRRSAHRLGPGPRTRGHEVRGVDGARHAERPAAAAGGLVLDDAVRSSAAPAHRGRQAARARQRLVGHLRAARAPASSSRAAGRLPSWSMLRCCAAHRWIPGTLCATGHGPCFQSIYRATNSPCDTSQCKRPRQWPCVVRQ